jgi:hypothetical protein
VGRGRRHEPAVTEEGGQRGTLFSRVPPEDVVVDLAGKAGPGEGLEEGSLLGQGASDALSHLPRVGLDRTAGGSHHGSPQFGGIEWHSGLRDDESTGLPEHAGPGCGASIQGVTG